MLETANSGDITLYLQRLSQGDSSAETDLADAVYGRLQHMARALIRLRASDVSLPPTALVNEVLLELVRSRAIQWKDREHFFRLASRLLRRRLIDHIRERNAAKRSGKNVLVDLEGLLIPSEDRFEEVLAVHEGLDLLKDFDPSLAELIEMSYFGGIGVPVLAELRGVSEKTIDRHLELGRRWLAKKFRFPCPSRTQNSADRNRR